MSDLWQIYRNPGSSLFWRAQLLAIRHNPVAPIDFGPVELAALEATRKPEESDATSTAIE